jgi:plastocyanin
MDRVRQDRRGFLRVAGGGAAVTAAIAASRLSGLTNAAHEGHGGTPVAGATPEASPSGATPAASSEATVTMVNLQYDPPSLSISAGVTVTWTNEDEVPHTVTGKDRTTIQSGTIGAGEQFSMTFDTPGTFPYSCEFHANMNGTVIVT